MKGSWSKVKTRYRVCGKMCRTWRRRRHFSRTTSSRLRLLTLDYIFVLIYLPLLINNISRYLLIAILWMDSKRWFIVPSIHPTSRSQPNRLSRSSPKADKSNTNISSPAINNLLPAQSPAHHSQTPSSTTCTHRIKISPTNRNTLTTFQPNPTPMPRRMIPAKPKL